VKYLFDDLEYIYTCNSRHLVTMREIYLERIMTWRNTQMRFLRQYKLLTLYNQKEWFETISSDPTQSIFAIIYNDTDEYELIGYCGIINIVHKNKTGEISFLVDSKRITSDEYKKDFLAVLNMLCEHGFNDLNLNKLYTETFSFRKTHLFVLNNFGFSHDGTLREHIYENGNYHDSFIHSLLKIEWREKYDNKR